MVGISALNMIPYDTYMWIWLTMPYLEDSKKKHHNVS